MGLRFNQHQVMTEARQTGAAYEAGSRRRNRALRATVSHAAILAGVSATLLGMAPGAQATTIDTSKTYYLASELDSGTSATFNGGTLRMDVDGKTYSRSFTLKDVTGNTIDAYGSSTVFSGKITGYGGITITDSSGNGGVVTFSNSNNDYYGTTTIDSGATLALIDSDLDSDTNTTSGTIEHSQMVTVNGTLDISGTVSGATLIGLEGSGNIVLGSETLTLYDYDSDLDVTRDTDTTFSGVISGKGSVILTSGEITLTGVNTFTGSLTVSSDTLHLSGAGSVSSAASVNVYGLLDATEADGPSVYFKSLAGSGTVNLGTNTLVLTNASGTFSGVISGSGGLVLESGTEYLSGDNTFTGGVTINGGTLKVGSSDVSYDVSVASGGIFAFNTTTTIDYTGVISGAGEVESLGSGISRIYSVQTYTGATDIQYGTLKLIDSGSIASSSVVTADGIFDITETTSGTSIISLAGSGGVRIGTSTLTITDASDTFSGAITGTGSLIIAGGTETLAGASTFSGSTSVLSGATLALSAGASIRSAVTLESGAAIDLSSGTTTTGSATILSLSGDGTVDLGANTLVLSYASGDYTGIISGTGNFYIADGTETLSAANTYTGTTTVAAGAELILSATGSLASGSKLAVNGTFDGSASSGSVLSFTALSGSGTVITGALGLELSDATGVFSGEIQGTGGLTISGGSQILSGTNDYTGGTVVASGASLQIGNGSSSGSITSDVANEGTLIFKRNNSYTYAGVISGSGEVQQNGYGTTILTGDSTYTGVTTISFGTLQLGDGGTTGSISNTASISNDGTLAFSRSDGITVDAVISGTGAVSVVSGSATLTAVESYTGVTKIAADATLYLTGSGDISSSSGVTANGTFDVSSLGSDVSIASLSGSGYVELGSNTLTLTDASGTFSGVISDDSTGSAGLILESGSETLSGINTYTGATLVKAGTLTVSGSIAASSGVTVQDGATLAGSGTVSALTVESGGTVKGTLGSTLTATGDVSLASGSTLAVSMTSTHSDNALITTSGSATVSGASLAITSSDGTFDLGNQITVLSADGGITGAQSTSSTFVGSDVGGNNDAVFKYTLTPSGNYYYLTVNLEELTPALASDATTNQKNVVKGIDKAIAAGNTLPADIENLGNDTQDQLSSDATALSGELGADLPRASRALFTPLLDAMADHIAEIQPNASGHRISSSGVETWGSVFAGSDVVTADAETGASKFRSNVRGVVMGANYVPWQNTVLGAALSVGTSTFRLNNDLGKGDGKSLSAGIYGYMQSSRHFYGSFQAGVGVTELKTSRVLTVDGDTLTGKANVLNLGGRYEAGVLLGWLTPYFAVQDQFTMLPSYTEKAASGDDAFALHYASQSANAGQVELGFRNSFDLAVTPRWILTPDWTMHLTDRVAYAYNVSNNPKADAQFAALSDSNFTVYGANAGKHAVLASVGADMVFDNGLRITSRLDTTFTEKSQSFTGFAGLGYTW